MRDDEFAITRKLVAFQDPLRYGFSGVKLACFECVEGKYFQAKPLNFEHLPNALGQNIEPFISIDKIMAQALFNDLWQIGYRPSDGTGNSGHVEALKYHLEDLRRLVFKNTKDK